MQARLTPVWATYRDPVSKTKQDKTEEFGGDDYTQRAAPSHVGFVPYPEAPEGPLPFLPRESHTEGAV